MDRPLDSSLAQIIRVGRRPGERMREPPQPRQERHHLVLECHFLRISSLFQDETSGLPRFIPA